MRFLVSIPHRQAQNSVSCPRCHFLYSCFNSSQVGSKLEKIKEELAASIRFQFLIGRLKTKRQYADLSTTVQFQFLIGRLKTRVGRSYVLPFLSFNSSQVGSKLVVYQPKSGDFVLFQFLIGRLKTQTNLTFAWIVLSFNSSQVGSKLYFCRYTSRY